jgi:hypothetical protein
MKTLCVTHCYPPGSCLSCGGVARVLTDMKNDPHTAAGFDCAVCGPLHYAPAYDDRGRKMHGFAKPAEAAVIRERLPDPLAGDWPFDKEPPF